MQDSQQSSITPTGNQQSTTASWQVKPRLILAILCALLGLCLLVGIFCFAGALIFKKLELHHEIDLIQEQKAYVHWKIEESAAELWNITASHNVLHREHWQAQAKDVMLLFIETVHEKYRERNDWRLVRLNTTDEEIMDDTQWTLPAALLFAMTTITKIGYGHLTPKTNIGRMVCIGYALIGIPLMLLLITTIGHFFTTIFSLLWKACKSPCCKRGGSATDASNTNENRQETGHVPIFLCLLVIVTHILAGALIFTTWEQWTFLEGVYFSFVTLSTIGFGDFVPGSYDPLQFFGLGLWLILGLSLMAMFFTSVHEAVKNLAQRFGQHIGIIEHNSADK